jgi:hypothetical protein
MRFFASAAYAPRRRRLPRLFEAFLSILLLVGQTALLAHHHAPASRTEGRPSLHRHDAYGADDGCRLCELSYQSFGAHAPSPRPVAAPDDVCGLIDAALSSDNSHSPLDPSSRAPPDA